MPQKEKYTNITVICEGGIASSAMGAAILRRVLNENGLKDIYVKACATDLAGYEAGLLICQRDYYRYNKDKLPDLEVYIVENLVHKQDCQELVKLLIEQGKI